MPRQNDDRRNFSGIRNITSGLTKKVSRIFRWLGEERGVRNEQNALDALMVLQEMGMPILFKATKKRGREDRQGMDIIIRGIKPLHLPPLALDIKSSRRGVELYLEEQKRILEETKRPQRPPRYTYYVPPGEGGSSCRFLQELSIFILEKSENYASKVWLFKRIDSQSKNGMRELAVLIEKIFSEESEF